MRGPSNATLDMDDHPNQDKRQSFNPREADEELYVGEDGLVAVAPMDDKSLLDKFKAQLERREQELRQAAEYGLGLLEANEELQMQVATLKIQLETETEELSVERDMWQRRTEHALQETAQWKRKFARVEEEKVDLAEEFEQFVDRCQCRGPDTEVSSSCEPTPSTGRRYSHHLDTIAQLQTELQELHAAERSNEAELMSLRQWKELAEQQQQEALECEVLAAQSEVSYRKKMETERAATQRTMNELKNENGQLRKAIIRFEEEVKALKKQLRLAEEARDDTQVHSNELSEELLSSKARCKRFQRELELLEHVSYFSQAIMDRDDEESDSDDEIVEEKDLQTVVACDEKSVVKNVGTTTSDNDTQDPAMPSPLRIRRRRSFLVATATPYSPFPTTTVAEDGTQVKVSESEMETHKKLHHYFHLTALSIINENNLLERCFSSSSRLTIDMWYREIVAKDIPFLKWHSWLINRISEVAASVQDADEVPQPPSSSSKGFGGAFLGFSLRKTSGSSDTEPSKNALPSPPMASSPAASPVARVPLAVARAFFRLLRKRTTNETEPDSSPVGGSPVNRSPVG